jgi:hypothetical protein
LTYPLRSRKILFWPLVSVSQHLYSLLSFIVLRDGRRLKDNIRIDPSSELRYIHEHVNTSARAHTHTHTHTHTHIHTQSHTHIHTQSHTLNANTCRLERKQEVSLNSGFTFQPFSFFLTLIARVFYCIPVGFWHAIKKSRQHSHRTFSISFLVCFFLLVCHYFIVLLRLYATNFIIILCLLY